MDVPTRIVLPVSAHSGATLFKPAYVHDSALGVKVRGMPGVFFWIISSPANQIVSVRPDNAAQGLPTVPALIMLFNIATGMPECIMDGTYLTGLRLE